ncbi:MULTISPECIES: tripartite tricarboxylate transporter substrate binding protein [unclassified Salinicola]|uniref:tripartite tricarboxylate transporter substrate binding protein n=1 Tax=unclassified Salinicola TaxID=2634022 RepID=UPI001A9067C6|nr:MULTISPECIES: tripartite tricarboxylate transporter substrate binding protein [unclassified Salinicola]MCE3026151.1 tripartite tricarboxylate transporter substrate binding protein [Salinicola sp. DM10]WIX31366.1 tripartite tricarboxylate transporter substrate binding protein [Salinicola sp. JS01]
MNVKRTLKLLLAAAVVASPAAWAEYPDKPITLIVPWAAGGGTDATARIIASALEQELGQTINVVNRTGGSGVVGHTAIANARPDGYTLGLATVELDMMHWQGLTSLTYQDFTPIGQINFDSASLSVGKESPFKDLEDFVTQVKSHPAGTYTASGTGLGGIWHVALNGFLMDQGIAAGKLTWIPSQGSAPAMTELASGSIDVVASSLPEARAMIEAGEIRSLGVMTPERLSGFPDIPTFHEQLGSDFSLGAWRGVVGPKGLDEAVVKRLETALKTAYDSDAYQNFMAKQGYGVVWRDADDFETLMAEDDAKFGEIMKQMGLAH